MTLLQPFLSKEAEVCQNMQNTGKWLVFTTPITGVFCFIGLMTTAE